MAFACQEKGIIVSPRRQYSGWGEVKGAQRAFLSPRHLAVAGAVVLVAVAGLLGITLLPKPSGQAQASTEASINSTSDVAINIPALGAGTKTFYVQINCGTVGVCTNGFDPGNLTIPAGSAVTWVSDENPEMYVYHRVVFRVGGIDSGQMLGESTFTATFSSPGVYQYYDADFPGNNGTITVVPAG
jgi:plastocyanin